MSFQYYCGRQEPRIIAVERLTIKERLSRLFTPHHHKDHPIFFEEPIYHPTTTISSRARSQSTISENTLLTPVTSHFDAFYDDDSFSETSFEDDEEEDDDEDEISSSDEEPMVPSSHGPQHQVALSVAILPAAVAAATAARTRRYQARARKAARNNDIPFIL
ncbi:predicted protein [Lichtheimia corymbifera JMRC:FSU:9682]|uniref:Uncharacterized protein n=1 Tax=Lichtheimia corymbifera JMRC:FSU:9682 TaxID=1263082 RepID=A0A068SB57_9FUNG|nr:predicted protein [Lichtheimia corymbifera JMRC:FSU:9682]CDH59608.1 predicted protein [Lichtheimia corymbifera JMRC:FSU:9682]